MCGESMPGPRVKFVVQLVLHIYGSTFVNSANHGSKIFEKIPERSKKEKPNLPCAEHCTEIM